MFRLKLVAGGHSEKVVKDGVEEWKTYHANDPKANIVESEMDLSICWPEKFVRLDGMTSQPAKIVVSPTNEDDEDELPEDKVDTFDAMTVAQMRTFAADNGIDLGHASNRSQILSILRNVD